MSWFRSGVPQIVLPVWYDACDSAIHVEYLSIRLWASKATAPHVDADFLRASVIVVVDSGKGDEYGQNKPLKFVRKLKFKVPQVLLHRSTHVLRSIRSSGG